jgi:hypothetical protein
MQHYEALLGVLMSTSDSRAQGLLADLRQDELARGILNRVDAGRFVSPLISSIPPSFHMFNPGSGRAGISNER